MVTLSMNCPHCGSTNEFFTDELPREMAVSCSSCGRAIGPWGRMVDEAEPSTAHVASARSFPNWPRGPAAPGSSLRKRQMPGRRHRETLEREAKKLRA